MCNSRPFREKLRFRLYIFGRYIDVHVNRTAIVRTSVVPERFSLTFALAAKLRVTTKLNVNYVGYHKHTLHEHLNATCGNGIRVKRTHRNRSADYRVTRLNIRNEKALGFFDTRNNVFTIAECGNIKRFTPTLNPIRLPMHNDITMCVLYWVFTLISYSETLSNSAWSHERMGG